MSNEDGYSRRDVLRQAAVASVVGGGAVGAFTGTVAAEGCDGRKAPDGFPYIQDGEAHGEFPEGPSELAIFIHGWQNAELESTDNAINQAYACDIACDHNGYTKPLVGEVWDADTEWETANDNAEAAGRVLASFIQDYQATHPDTAIRLLGHSLGARVTVTCLDALAADGDSVASAALIGGAIDDQSVATTGAWGPAIRDAAGQFNNYHKTDDAVLRDIYGTYELGDAVGEVGVDGDPPANYRDHNVTDTVEEHCTYFRKGNGCMPAVVQEW